MSRFFDNNIGAEERKKILYLCLVTIYLLMISGCAGSSGGSSKQGSPSSLSAPSALTAAEISTISISFSWQDNSENKTGFELECSSNGIDYTVVQTTSDNVTSVIDNGLDVVSRYYYKISAYDGSENSSYCSIIQVPSCYPDCFFYGHN